MTITVRNTDTLLWHSSLKSGAITDFIGADGGPLRLAKHPVTITVKRPTERVLLRAPHNPNPFALFASMIWALSGTNDIAMLLPFTNSPLSSSSDGRTVPNSMGYRWRSLFGIDQLAAAVSTLKQGAPTVLAAWAPQVDIERDPSAKKGASIAELCMHVYEEAGYLHGHVFAHSARLLFDVAGAGHLRNSAALELLASALALPVGRLHYTTSQLQISVEQLAALRTRDAARPCMYFYPDEERTEQQTVTPFPLLDGTDLGSWLGELETFCELGPIPNMRHLFFRRVAGPIMQAWHRYKTLNHSVRYDEALKVLDGCVAEDWRYVCQQWLHQQRNTPPVNTASELI